MTQSEVQKELERFRDYVIKEARTNLTRNKKNVSKGLYESLKGNVKAMPNSFSMDFEMNQYGQFQDKGVKGKDPNALPVTAKNYGVQKAPNSPYKFGTGSGQKGGLTKSLDKWIIRKGLAPRDKDGKFMSRRTLKFLMARSIYFSGIKPSLFFTKPFEAAFKRLPDELVEKFGLDAMNLFKETQFKNEKKNG
jgi:hypothetical protein